MLGNSTTTNICIVVRGGRDDNLIARRKHLTRIGQNSTELSKRWRLIEINASSRRKAGITGRRAGIWCYGSSSRHHPNISGRTTRHPISKDVRDTCTAGALLVAYAL